MKSGPFDSEILQEADGNKKMYTTLHGLEYIFRYRN